MDQTDSFISEVTEEVRRDRFFGVLRKYGWLGIVAVIAIVGGASWYEWRERGARLNSEAFGDDLLAALQADDPLAQLDTLQGAGLSGGQQAVVRLAASAQAARDGKVDVALADLTAISQDAKLSQTLRDLALMKAVILGGDKMSATDRDAAFARLTIPGAPFRLMALEQQAIADLAAGNTDAALAKAREIESDAGATPGLQQRAGQLIVVLGGAPEAPVQGTPVNTPAAE